jgi:glycosyltransferase involved in cell wall biosynthesis
MMAHILVIADGRSTTARSWIVNLQALGYDVSLVSTYPCDPPEDLREVLMLTVAFNKFAGGADTGQRHNEKPNQVSTLRKLARRLSPLVMRLRYVFGPLTLRAVAQPYRDFVDLIRPDLVHALRIPFEGMLGSFTPEGIPFLAATWGNDLTLHAKGSPWMRSFTRRCLQRADGLTSDTQRDIRLAHEWGLADDAPTLVVPGSGGLNLEAILQTDERLFHPEDYAIPSDSTWVVNPRGLRPGSVHHRTFIEAIPKVLAEEPNTIFICPNLAGIKKVQNWVAKRGVGKKVFLLPHLPQPTLWALLKRSLLFVSPSSHDGTPNSLLEALACGCYPVAGRIESLEAWITPGVNGALVNPHDSDALAAAIISALRSPEAREEAAARNLALIRERADQAATRPQIDAFYARFIAPEN